METKNMKEKEIWKKSSTEDTKMIEGNERRKQQKKGNK